MKCIILIAVLVAVSLFSNFALADVRFYNFTDSTNNKAYNTSAAGGVPPAWTNNWDGVQAASSAYTALSSDNNVYAPTDGIAGNQEPFWRFNFTINEAVSSITRIDVHFNGYENAGEAGACYMANFTNPQWFKIGVMPTADGNLKYAFTSSSDISKIIMNGNKQLVLMCQGDNFDAGDKIFADFVNVTVYYTPAPPDTSAPQYSNNATSKTSGTQYNPSNNYGFQIRWIDATAVDKVLFETNLNSTLKNFTTPLYSGSATDGIYVINFTSVGAGNYQYKWYANDTLGYMNASFPITSYSVAQNTTNIMNMSLNNGTTYWNQNITAVSGTQTTVQGYNQFANSGTPLLWRDEVSVSNPETQTLAIALYQYRTNTSGNANYTANTTGAIFYVNITSAPPDNTPPIITIQSPTNTTYSTGNIWFNVTLNEAGSVGFVDWKTGNKTLTNSTGNWNYNNASMPNAVYTAIFYLNDTSNNWNKTNVTFTINVPPPEPIKVFQWVQVTNWTNTTINYTLSVVVINNRSVSVSNVQVNPDSQFGSSYTIPSLASGEQNITVLQNYTTRNETDYWFNVSSATLSNGASGSSNSISMIRPVDPPLKGGVGCSLSVGLSNILSQGIYFDKIDPSQSGNATGNNNASITDYNLTITVSGCSPNAVDVYIKANDDLKSLNNIYSIAISNEKFANSTTDNTVGGGNPIWYALSIIYQNIAWNKPTGTTVYTKYRLSIPSNQQASNYNNTIYLKTVLNGQAP